MARFTHELYPLVLKPTSHSTLAWPSLQMVHKYSFNFSPNHMCWNMRISSVVRKLLLQLKWWKKHPLFGHFWCWSVSPASKHGLPENSNAIWCHVFPFGGKIYFGKRPCFFLVKNHHVLSVDFPWNEKPPLTSWKPRDHHLPPVLSVILPETNLWKSMGQKLQWRMIQKNLWEIWWFLPVKCGKTQKSMG